MSRGSEIDPKQLRSCAICVFLMISIIVLQLLLGHKHRLEKLSSAASRNAGYKVCTLTMFR